jgi:hypothetical protein
MKTPLKQLLATAMVALAMASAPTLAADKKKETADSVVTVYVAAHGGSSMAKKINASHAEMEAAGWRFAELEIHTENGDTEGAWITYTK